MNRLTGGGKAWMTWALLGLATACVKHYAPPQGDQPHAIVKFRRRYEQLRGTSLRETLFLSGERAFLKDDRPAHAAVPRTDAVLVHPGQVELKMSANFSHVESYFVQESYSCGTTSSYRTCYRTVQRQRTVSDGSCKQEMSLVFAAEKTYLLELDYQDRRNCHARCFEQIYEQDGSFENRPCQLVPPGESD